MPDGRFNLIGCLIVGVLCVLAASGLDGAEHWAFVKPERPGAPEVADRVWVRGRVDRFVLARLEATGLTPSEPASRATLIRRVYLDLTGLPPSPRDVEAFVADTSPDAYERLVDRLLNDPAYGERWAAVWLDLARYADTRGYQLDFRRNIWRYRDWVIDAYNRDKPYDEFTIEQIAGDLLPGVTDEQLLATAFHRNTMSNDEMGTNDEEFRVAAVKDRVDTTMLVWMGLTAGCAKCHDHKYDPITITDYYGLYAIFNQTTDADRFDEKPVAAFPTDEMKRRDAPILRKLAELEAGFMADDAELDEAQKRWERATLEDDPWVTLLPRSAQALAEGTVFTPQSDGSILVEGFLRQSDEYTLQLETQSTGITAIRLDMLSHPDLPLDGPGRDELNARVHVEGFDVKAVSKSDPTRVRTIAFARAVDDEGNAKKAGTILDDNAASAWAAGNPGLDRYLIFYADEPFGFDGGTEIEVRIKQGGLGGLIGCYRLSVTTVPDISPDTVVSRAVLAVLRKPGHQRTGEERALVRKYFRGSVPSLEPLRQQIAAQRRRLSNPPEIPIMRELPPDERRVTFVHTRGDYMNLGAPSAPALPVSFGHPSNAAPVDRLALARWVVSRSNPLTARVAVNRMWARFFGIGIVETEEDFGTQGERPSHPNLLDDLAADFSEDGSLKKLARRIVLSSTYRQSSRASAESLRVDPRNRLLSRGPRFRLEAEMVRDHALASAGLLTREIGGKSVMPPQPDGVWDVFGGAFDRWNTSQDADRYRRGLYTFVRRTSPYPPVLAFDVNARDVCTPRRIRTNTPLQALVTLNDLAFVEAARAMARRLRDEGGDSPEEKVDYAYRLVLSRGANETEGLAMVGLYNRRISEYRANRSSAVQIMGDPAGGEDAESVVELAAWTIVCQTILNLDEALTKN